MLGTALDARTHRSPSLGIHLKNLHSPPSPVRQLPSGLALPPKIGLYIHRDSKLGFRGDKILKSIAPVCGNLADKFFAEVLAMTNVPWTLTVVMIIAAWEILSVLKDIRKALQAITEDGFLSASALVCRLDAVVGEQGRIGDILGGILADMPRRPREPYQPAHRPDSDKFRPTNEERNELGSFKVVDRRICPTDDSDVDQHS